MIELNWTRARLAPFAHQREGVRALLGVDARGRADTSVLGLFDDVGAGKSKQTIDSAHFLREEGVVDTLLVVAPAFARGVWANPDPVLGEIAKHAWRDVENVVQVYHADSPTLDLRGAGLQWVVTNYEFIRRKDRLEGLLRQMKGRRTWLVLDEAWAIKSHKSDGWKACRALRKIAGRATLLNGTPIAHSPIDLYAQMMLLNPRILFPRVLPKTIGQGFMWFRGRYAIMGGYMNKEIVGWQNLDELNALVAPYILRRETRECIDLPPILPPVTLEAPLSPATWRLYTEMRDDLIAWLDENHASVAKQAIVKGLRLAQLCSGFLGGLQSLHEQADLFDGEIVHQVGQAGFTAPREIGREKLTVLLEWLEGQPHHKLLIWSRFRAELDRTATALADRYPHVTRLWGGQDPAERERAVRSLAPDGDSDPAIVVGTTGAGGAGLNLAGANIAIYLSNDFNLKTRLQADGRIDRPGQTRPVQYVDIVATGPKGQKTIDHHVLAALREKRNVAEWSAQQWRDKLREE
jgi:SNF2 family DNA or RNA helicase